MAGSPAEAEQLARGVLVHYEEAERILMERIAKNLGQGIDAPAWAEQKLAQVRKYMQQAREVIAALESQAESSLDAAMLEAYRRGGLQAVYDLERAGTSAVTVDPLAGMQAIQALQQATMTQLNSTSLRVLSVMGEAYQEIINLTVQQVLLGTLTRRQATQGLLTKFAQKGVTGFTDVAGRKWNLNTYAEMATRTGTAQAWRQGHLDTLVRNEVDLVVISDAPSSCPICEMFEGEVFSIRGVHPDYPSLDSAIDDGLFHCNCRHGFSPWEEGITRPLEKAQTHEQNAAGYAASQRQRGLERQIRAAKREQAVALDPMAAAKARKKIEVARSKIRSLLDDHPELRRKPFRESMGVSRKELAALRERELAQVRDMGQMARPESAPAVGRLEELSKPDEFGARWTADRKFSIEGRWPYTAHYLAPDGVENMGVFNTVKEAREAIAAKRLSLGEKPVVPKPIEKPITKPTEPEIVSKPDEWGIRWTDDREYYISGKWPYDLYHKTKLADGTFVEEKVKTFNTVKEAREAIGIERAKLVQKPVKVELEELEKISKEGNRWAKDQQYVIRGRWPYTLSKNVDGNLVDLGTYNTVAEAREALRLQRAEDLLKPVIPKPVEKPTTLEALTKPDIQGRRWTADNEFYVDGTYPYTLWAKNAAGGFERVKTYESVKLAKAEIASRRGGTEKVTAGEKLAVEKRATEALAKETQSRKVVLRKVANSMDDIYELPAHPDWRIIRDRNGWLVERLRNVPGAGDQWIYFQKFGFKDEAQDFLSKTLIPHIAKDQPHLTYTRPGSMAHAQNILQKITGTRFDADTGLAVKESLRAKFANETRMGGKKMSETWQVEHADRLMSELTDLFNRFPKLKRNANKTFYDVKVDRASAHRGGGGSTWADHNWTDVSYLTPEQQQLRYLGGQGLHPYSSYFPGREIQGTIRHEYCHSLQEWKVVDQWEGMLAGMGKHQGRFNKWYKENISQYVGDHPNVGKSYEVETMAECFTRWTEAPSRRVDVSQWPQEVQDFMNKLCNGGFR